MKVKNLSIHYLLILLVAAMITGCSLFEKKNEDLLPTEAKVLMSYGAMGAALETALPILKSMCADGSMSAGDCIKAQTAYNEAYDVYFDLGEIASKVIDTGNDKNYQARAAFFMRLLSVVQTYTGGN